ncbi:protein AHNAK2 isoform A [Alligator mississippiensis]|uniref:Protein AHNAK2 isoform A n=1 Tax=Alligator mississippiensis TaxID=8496 RepID=A0A151M224_ALLMI|nr:protein AHNAK2 isoform A [Alligator mississippiensis]
MPGSHPKLEEEISESKVDPDIIVEGEPILISSAGSSADVPDVKGDLGGVNINLPKFRIPSLGFSKLDISSLKSDQESSLPSVDVMLTKYQVSVEVPEIKSDTAISDVTLSQGETQVAATQSSGELKNAEVDADISVDDTDVNVEGLEGKVKKPKFHKPKIGFSLSQGKVGKTDLNLTETETETPVAKLAADVTSISIDTPSFDIKSKVSSSEIEVSDLILPMPMLKMPHKPKAEGKAPSVDISLPLDDVKMSKAEMDIHGPDLESKAVKGESEVKLEEKDPEGKESKFKMPKFKLPSFSWSPKKEAIVQSDIEGTLEGRILTSPSGETESFEIIQTAPESQGLSVELDRKVMEAESGAEVPHLKVMTDITEIAVEAPTLEVKSVIPGAETEAASYKIKMHQMSETEFKAAKVDVRLPSVDVSIPKAEIQDSDMAVKPEGEIKPGDADGDEKEGHFKLPKFKLPSFNWSPKKETTVKADSEALEECEITVAPGKIDPKLTVIPAEDQGSSVDPDIKVSTGKEEQKSQMKKPQFAMPKISLSKIKVPKSQVNLPKGEADRDDSVQIPDIESSRSESMDEGTQISIKPSKVKIPTLEFSKPEIKPPKVDIDVSLSKADTTLPALDAGVYQADLILGSGSEDISLKTDIKLPEKEASIKLKSPESDVEGPSAVDGAEAKVEDLEGKIKMPGFQKPKFGISLTKGKGPEMEISLPKMEAEVPQLKLTTDITDLAMDTSVPKVKSDVSGEGLEASAEKIKTGPLPAADIKAPKVDISLPSVSDSTAEVAILSPEGKDIKMEGEHETKSGEIQTGEHQGWFKMPKFRMPTFGRSSSKEKKSDVDFEGSLEKAQISVPSVEIQGEISAPENANLLPQVDAESAAGKAVLESTMKSVQEEIPKLGVSVPKIKSSDVSLSKFEADVSLTAEKSGIDMSFPKTETYADVVKRSADGQKLQVHMPKTAGPQVELTASEISASKTITLPRYDLTLQEHKAKSECVEVPSAECHIEVKSPDTGVRAAPGEITVDGTQGESDFAFPKAELDIQGLTTSVKTEKGKGEIKSAGKDVQGKESKFKIPKFSVPSLGWSATKETGDVSLPETEIGIAEIQFQKEEGSIDLKGPKTELKEPSTRMSVDSTDQQREPEINVKIPKLRIPSFTYSALPPEVDVSTSKMTIDAKGAAVDTEAQILEVGSAVPPEILEAVGGTIQRSTAIFPPSTELDIKTTQVEMMLPAAEFCIPKAALDSPRSHVESKQIKTEGDVESGRIDIEKHETYSTQIVKESEILPSEIKTAAFGFSLLKAKIPESQINLDIPVKQQSYTEYKSAEFESEVHQVKQSDDSSGTAMERTDTAEHELLDKPQCETEVSGMAVSVNVSLPELKSFAVEVQPSSKLEEGPLDKQPEEVTVSPLSKDSEVAEVPEDEKKDMKDQKEKPDSKRSPGRFKFWLPSIGFSSSVDDTSLDSKTEVKKPEETQPADTSTSDTDSSKQTEKTGWFRFPKLGFTSPSKKAKMVDKEETNLKERKSSDEESPSETHDTFFDAKESLSPKEATTKSEDNETGTSSDVQDSGAIVTSSARTELILLEEERASQ